MYDVARFSFSAQLRGHERFHESSDVAVDRVELLALDRTEILKTARDLRNLSAEPGKVISLCPLDSHGSHSQRLCIPLFCVPGQDENPYDFQKLAEALGPDQPFHALRDPRAVAERGDYTVIDQAAYFPRAILAFQPHGPYVIGGHSYGGYVAFEIARIISEAGGDVALTILFDTPARWFAPERGLLDGLRQVAEAIRTSGVRELDRAIRTFCATRGGRAKTAIHAALVRLGVVQLKPFLAQARQANRRALPCYRPAVYRGRVLALIARDSQVRPLADDDPRLAWRRSIAGGFDYRLVPGDHNTMLSSGNAEALARVCKTSLPSPRAEATAA